MSAGKINLVIEKGAKFSKRLQWKDSAGSPIPLTDYGARMQIRKTKISNTVEAELSTDNGKITFDAPNGIITLSLGATETDTFDFSNGVYDLELYKTADSDDVTRLVEGIVTISNNITR
jgi:hypothetical protein